MTLPTPPDPNTWLMGGGIPSAKFDAIGTTVAGDITEEPTIQQQRNFDTGEPEFWTDGNPKYMLVVNIHTAMRDPDVDNDDGTRGLYVRANLQKAIRDAVRLAGADRLQVGGHLTITYTGDGTPPRKGANAPKLYTAVYKPPQQQAAQQFLGLNQPAPATYTAPPPNAVQQAAQNVATSDQPPTPTLSPEAIEALKALGYNLGGTP